MSLVIAIDDGFPLFSCIRLLQHFDLSSHEIHLLSVVDISHIAATYHQIPEMPYSAIIDDAKEHYAQLHKNLSNDLRQVWPQLKINSLVKEGYVVHEVSEVCQSLGCDALICGARGLKGLKKWFLGSISSQVLNQTTVPTFILKQQIEAKAELSSKNFKILVASDDSEPSRRCVDFMARHFQNIENITVISVLQNRKFFQHHAPDNIKHWTILKEAVRRDAETQAQKMHSNSKSVSSLMLETPDSPATAIFDQCAKDAVDLLVFGKTGKSAMEKITFGSIANQLATQADCHILVVP